MQGNISEDIIEQALCTYIAKGTRYLKEGQIERLDKDKIILNATFEIKESCYLFPYSGHFNAVEAIMCFNQMLYVALLGGIERKFFSFYSHISPQEFNKYRRKVYILEFEKVKFRKQIDNANFFGRFEMEKLKTVGDKIYMNCVFQFGNTEGGSDFSGVVKVFIPLL